MAQQVRLQGKIDDVGHPVGRTQALRRDRHARVLLDLPRRTWTALLRAMLGNPYPAYAATSTGRGVLLRLLLGEHLDGLLHDDDLVLTLCLAAPGRGERSWVRRCRVVCSSTGP